MAVDPIGDGIDPTWWESVFNDLDEYELPELLSSRLQTLASEESIGDFQKLVLETLTKVTSAMLTPEDWNSPFTPAMQFGGQRTLIPSDLDSDEIALLARIAPLIQRPDLRARVADVAWTYGDRSNTVMLELAIDAYRAAPLDDRSWFGAGEASWRRAFGLTNRRGEAGRAVAIEMTDALIAQVAGATVGDGFLTVQWAKVARTDGRPTDRQSVADVLTRLAAEASLVNPRLSRHLERESLSWLAGSDNGAAWSATERIARTYLAEADERIKNDPVQGALVETIHLEKAIAVFRTLPRTYRESHSIDELVWSLQDRLQDGRERTLETMTSFASEPIDLSGATGAARARVTGIADRTKALAAFVTVAPARTAEDMRETSRAALDGTIAHIFPTVHLASDGRKVAASAGTGGELGDDAIWNHVASDIARYSQMIAFGVIQPALQVLTLEHHFDREYFLDLCLDSPVVPEGHGLLWASGINAGFSGDMGTAISIVVPQVEHLVRTMLNRHGVRTLFVDDRTGVESEKSLPALLDMEEVTTIFGEGLVMELKALLIFQGGPNLRHNVAHGLLDDASAWSMHATYVWWFCLRLALWPTVQALREAQPNADTDTDTNPQNSDADGDEANVGPSE